MTQEDARTLSVVYEICNSRSIFVAYNLYLQHSESLKDYKFVFASNEGGVPGFAMNCLFSAGAAVRSLFNTERVLVLDRDIVQEMAAGPATYPIDYSISLDTQAVSYLEPYFAGKSGSRMPKDVEEVFEFIARDDVRVDPIPYRLENFLNVKDEAAALKIFYKWKAYETLRTLDTDWMRERREVRSKLTECELNQRAQNAVSEMLLDAGNDTRMISLAFKNQVIYACLLKMVSVQFRFATASFEKKLNEFLDFCESQLATIFLRLRSIAYEYFKRGQNLKFFGKVQRGRGDLFEQLRNMAWDLWHVHYLELAMTFNPSGKARYFSPALLTFDKRLIEVIDLYPLKACAFKVGSFEPLPFPERDWSQFLPTNRYFSEEARMSRSNRRRDAKAGFFDLVNQLEDEIRFVAGIDK